MDNHYSTLGVDENATDADIKKAYRKLASIHHPDKGGDTEKFKAIQTAYDVIGNKEKRAEYDVQRNMRNPAFGNGVNLDDLFRNFGFRASRNIPKNKDIQIQIILDLTDTLQDQQKILNINTGATQKTVNVTILRGVRHGHIIKYPALGDKSLPDLPAGDLYVHVAVKQHPKFQVYGDDLITPIDINCLHAIIGTTYYFKSLEGTEYELTIPPGTQHGTKFKIANKGLYQYQQSHRGDLYLIAQLKVPTDLTESQLDTIKQIAQ